MEINYLQLECVDSTNTWCKQNYSDFDKHKITLVTANQQLKGRGRFKRNWLSEPGQCILATFTLFFPKTRKDIGNLTQTLAVSAAKMLKKRNIDILLKWPNDLFFHQKKLGGILCETITTESHLVVIIGIGINVNVPSSFLNQIDQPATSLLAETGNKYPLKEMIVDLKQIFATDVDLFIKEGFKPFLQEFRSLILHKQGDSLLINSQIGNFVEIDEHGALVILKDNVLQKHVAGEIESL